jgi:hypothetical protein
MQPKRQFGLVPVEHWGSGKPSKWYDTKEDAINNMDGSKLLSGQVILERFDCGNPSHSHDTVGALACIKRQERKRELARLKAAGAKFDAVKWTHDDYLELLAEYRSGLTQVDLAKKRGIIKSACRYRLNKALRIERDAIDRK